MMSEPSHREKAAAAVNSQHQTLLHEACRLGNGPRKVDSEKLVKLLLEIGIDHSVRDKHHKTAADYLPRDSPVRNLLSACPGLLM